ncbi:MAG: FxLD family lanthipeptide [Pseudonocardiales bacterium]|nr:FxLD family lanthipeptide [Pseudonocardiales bacterium]
MAKVEQLKPQVDEAAEADPFDLDVRIAETGDVVDAQPTNPTDDKCGSTCPLACVSAS